MKRHPLPYILLSVILMFSCKPQVPNKFIQPDEFESILYDFHLADAMAEDENTGETDAFSMSLNRNAVLKKHDITQAEFDSSLVYYVRHADRLHKIYENLSKRLSDEALTLGASANDISRYGDLKSARDTSNLWRGITSCVLTTQTPYNVMAFEIPADSSYHKGDKIIFSFKTDFIYKSGTREGRALLAIEYKNDSIGSRNISISSNNDYSIMVSDDNHKGIKAIRGFVYLYDKNKNEYSNELRLMSIYNIRLVRMRDRGEATPFKTNNATVGSDSMKSHDVTAPSSPKDVYKQTGVEQKSITGNEDVRRLLPQTQHKIISVPEMMHKNSGRQTFKKSQVSDMRKTKQN